MANPRMSMYSVASDGLGPRLPGQQSTQVSTTTLLNAVHNIYLSSQPYRLDAGASLGGTVDAALSARVWEHARRRAEDGCVILGYVDPDDADNVDTIQPQAMLIRVHPALALCTRPLRPY